MPDPAPQVIDHPAMGVRSQIVSPFLPSLSFTNVMSHVDRFASRIPWWLWFLSGVASVLVVQRIKAKGAGHFFAFGKRGGPGAPSPVRMNRAPSDD